jgi:hypothetical protein
MYRQLNLAEWRHMGSPVPEVFGTPPIPPDNKNCSDYASRYLAERDFTLWRNEGYGDVYGLDADNDGQACEDSFRI